MTGRGRRSAAALCAALAAAAALFACVRPAGAATEPPISITIDDGCSRSGGHRSAAADLDRDRRRPDRLGQRQHASAGGVRHRRVGLHGRCGAASSGDHARARGGRRGRGRSQLPARDPAPARRADQHVGPRQSPARDPAVGRRDRNGQRRRLVPARDPAVERRGDLRRRCGVTPPRHQADDDRAGRRRRLDRGSGAAGRTGPAVERRGGRGRRLRRGQLAPTGEGRRRGDQRLHGYPARRHDGLGRTADGRRRNECLRDRVGER